MDLPFELREGRVWISTRIQGRPAWAIFDTGADGTAVDASFAAEAGLVGSGGQKGTTVAAEVQMVKAGPAEFALGTSTFAAEDVMLIPLAKQMPGLQAILGFDVLRRFPFTLDYRMGLIRVGSLPSGPAFPFIAEHDIRPTTTVETRSTRFESTIDTGSSKGLSLPVSWVSANAPELLGSEMTREILGSRLSARPFVIDGVRLGGIDLNRIPGEAVSSEGGSFAAQHGRWANIGNEVLRRFRLGIDGVRRVSVFQYEG